MRRFFRLALSFTMQHLDGFLVSAIAIVLFSVFSGFAVQEAPGRITRFFTIFGGTAGAAAGGIGASLVGGIGIAAMGTAVAVPALAVIGLGTLFGGVLGFVAGGVGAGLLDALRNPSDFVVNWGLLLVIAAACVIAARLILTFAKKLYSILRRIKVTGLR